MGSEDGLGSWPAGARLKVSAAIWQQLAVMLTGVMDASALVAEHSPYQLCMLGIGLLPSTPEPPQSTVPDTTISLGWHCRRLAEATERVVQPPPDWMEMQAAVLTLHWLRLRQVTLGVPDSRKPALHEKVYR